MKKLISLILCLVMALSLTAAAAEELPAVDFNEANIADIGGEWMLLEQFGLQMYLPDIFTMKEVPEELAAQGYLAVMGTEDMSAGITITYGPLLDGAGNQISTHADLVNYYSSNGYENIATCLINGLEATNFLMTPDRDMMSVVYFLADGNALTFYYTPVTDESMLALFSIVSSTVMAAE